MSLLSVRVAVLWRSVLLFCLLWLLLAGVGGRFCFLVANVEAGAPSYVYDDLGRLIAVIDLTGGDTAIYQYDAVGNLLGIIRQPASTVTILNFTPKSGPIGTTVTIAGTGFSTTASQNTVTFNGTAATVSAATATQLVVTVPAGATTGPIGVTTPTGSATSGVPFTLAVGGVTSAPTISGFSPTTGPAGTAVTISGENFDPTLAGNKVSLNNMLTSVSAATPTSLTTSVPSFTASGKITVTTVGGVATSATDFIIPPPGYTTADIESASRVSIGQSVGIGVATANKVALRFFEGTPGQRLSIHLTNSTFGSCSGGNYQIVRPDGLSVVGVSPLCSGSFLNPIVLPLTGTYTLVVNPYGTATGSATFTLYDVPADLTGAVTAGGAAVSATIGTPGQMARFTFDGTAGQKVSALMNSASICSGSFSILRPDSTTLVTTQLCTGTFLDAVTLPETGVYSLLFNPNGADTGTFTATLYTFTDVTGPITVGGSAVTSTTDTPGQNVYLTFSGTATQRVSVLVNASTMACNGGYGLKKPDGSNLIGSSLMCTGSFINVQTLPTTGTYTLYLDPAALNTGQVTVTLYNVPSDVSGSITPGAATTVTIETPGQDATLTFTATAGQQASVQVNSSTMGTTAVAILQPNGSSVGSISTASTTFLDALTLPVTGTYTVSVNPSGANTGQMTLTLYTFNDVSGALTINAAPVPVSTTTPGQNANLTFAGTAAQLATVRITGNTFGSVSVTLKKPDGSTLIASSSISAAFNLPQQTLPTTGTYTVTVNPTGVATGGLNLQVTSP